MTGFARAAGAEGASRWSWELRSVNAKGLDLPLHLPPGFTPLEGELRGRLSRVVTRGAVTATLAIQREKPAQAPRIDVALLAALAEAVAAVPRPAGLGPASLDALLAVRGVVDVVEPPEDEAQTRRLHAAVLAGFDDCVAGLCAMRAGEGAALGTVLAGRLDRMAALARAADACPGRQPAAVEQRLRAAIARLTEVGTFEPARLHQEAVLLAAKADVREELDRLYAHVEAARDLLAGGGPVGRRLDFLAQELGREANTLGAKSNDADLTAIGMDLRVEVEQLREQVQNIE